MARSKKKSVKNKIAAVKMKRMKLKDISPAEYNPRTITDESLAGLGKSVDEFGYVEPLVVNIRTDRLVSGHQRFKVLTARGVDEADVAIVDLDEVKEKALNITMKSEVVRGNWSENISDLLTELKQDGEFEELFSDLRFDVLLNEVGPPIDELVIESDIVPRLDESKKDKKIICPECKHEFFQK